MVDRPRRERKPTQHFEYRDDSTDPSVARDAVSKTRQGTPSSKTRRSARVRDLDVSTSSEWHGEVSGQVGSSRSRDGSRTPASGIGRSRRHKSDFNTNADLDAGLDDTPPSIYSGQKSIRDTWETLNDSGFDGNGSADEDDIILYGPANTKRRCITSEKQDLEQLHTESDIVIEQWYADPYERVNPDGISYDQWRYQNLQFGMMSQGFSMVKAKAMASWLMRCDGRYKDFEASRSKNGVRKPRKRARAGKGKLGESNTPLEDTAPDLAQNDEDRTISARNDETTDSAVGSSATYHSRPVSGKLRRNKDNTRPTTGNIDHTGQQEMRGDPQSSHLRETEHSEGKKERSNDTEGNVQSMDVNDMSDAYQLDVLKRNLKLFDVVYGPHGPQTDPAKFSHNYFSGVSTLPTLVPTIGLFTQGHYVLQQGFLPADDPAFHNGIELPTDGFGVNLERMKATHKQRAVLTEDPDFGLTLFPEKDTATDEEMREYYMQFERSNKRHQSLPDIPTSSTPIDTDGPLDKIPHGKERRTFIQEQNKGNATIIAEELKQRIFDWETPYTMQGGAPKLSKDDELWQDAFAVRERHVWKEIRERQRILDEGGEAAAKLLEKEWVAEQLEIKREERRRQTAQSKARKRAACNEHGTGISGWTAEE